MSMRGSHTHTHTQTRGALAGAMLLALGACSSGGNVDIGSGQSPDPAAVDFAMAYVKRTLPVDMGIVQGDDLREMRDAVPDADLFIRPRADPTAPETNVTERVTGNDLYDVRDVEVSHDGLRIVFAMRGPLDPNQDEEDPPTWNIWEYEPATDTLRRVIASDIIAEEGHDVAPHYLPDGRIVFSSTRQRQSKAVLLDEGKSQFEAQTSARNEPAFVLHVMNADGSGIRQVSFNTDHDLDPTVLANGKLMWSRWDNPPGGRNAIHLYQSNPDGTGLELLYGAQSHLTGSADSRIEFVKAREAQSGDIVTLIRPFTDTEFGGNLQFIDVRGYVENSQGAVAGSGLTGPAQRPATGNDVRTVPGISPGGRFTSAFPLWDGTGRMVVSWSQCRAIVNAQERPCTNDVVSDPTAQPAPPLYSLWMYDTRERAFLPLMTPQPGIMVTDVVIAQPRTRPAVIIDKTPGVDLNPDYVAEGVGILDIRSVYDFDGVDAARLANGTPSTIRTVANPVATPPDQRLYRFIRIEKPVSIPDDDVLDIDGAAFGATNFMREILAYAPIEPDGSVRIKVPANVAFQMSLLDANGRRAGPVHRNWLQLRPGEVRTCNGCHVRDPQAPTSHGRDGVFASVYSGAQTTGAAFPGTSGQISPDAGETMAQARARWSNANENGAALNPSVNVSDTDVWTAADATAPATLTSYTYGALSTTAPTTADCATRWAATCRIVINYEQHIHPLWSLPRQVIDPVTQAVLVDNTCTSCHTRVGAANAPQVPAGQLELTDGPSQDEPLHFNAYRELLFADEELELVNGVLQVRLVQTGVDPVTGLPILSPVTVPPSLAAGNARGSTRFFARFAAGGSHADRLTPSELRLLSEWVDIGAQYYNNPFDPGVPLD